MVVAALGFSAVAQPALAQPSGAWFTEIAVAHVFGADGLQSDLSHAPGSGTACYAALGRQTLPWLAFTGEARVFKVNEVLFGFLIPEDFWTVDAGTHATLMAGLRIGPPIDLGLTPSFEVATGMGWLHWGDRHVTSINGPPQTIAGDREVVWTSSVGFRLRYATRPRQLTPEAMTHAIVLVEQGHPLPMLTLGLGLRY